MSKSIHELQRRPSDGYTTVWVVGTPAQYPGTEIEGCIVNSLWFNEDEALNHATEGQTVDCWGIHGTSLNLEAPSVTPKSKSWWRWGNG